MEAAAFCANAPSLCRPVAACTRVCRPAGCAAQAHAQSFVVSRTLGMLLRGSAAWAPRELGLQQQQRPAAAACSAAAAQRVLLPVAACLNAAMLTPSPLSDRPTAPPPNDSRRAAGGREPRPARVPAVGLPLDALEGRGGCVAEARRRNARLCQDDAHGPAPGGAVPADRHREPLHRPAGALCCVGGCACVRVRVCVGVFVAAVCRCGRAAGARCGCAHRLAAGGVFGRVPSLAAPASPPH
jgi:hypothetical protein